MWKPAAHCPPICSSSEWLTKRPALFLASPTAPRAAVYLAEGQRVLHFQHPFVVGLKQIQMKIDGFMKPARASRPAAARNASRQTGSTGEKG